jgi:hypothetical protein
VLVASTAGVQMTVMDAKSYYIGYVKFRSGFETGVGVKEMGRGINNGRGWYKSLKRHTRSASTEREGLLQSRRAILTGAYDKQELQFNSRWLTWTQSPMTVVRPRMVRPTATGSHYGGSPMSSWHA